MIFKRLLLISLILCFCSTGFSQIDRDQIIDLREKAILFESINRDSSLWYNEKILELIALNDTDLSYELDSIGKRCLIDAITWSVVGGNSTDAEKYIELAYTDFYEAKDQNLMGELYYQIGRLYSRKDELELARMYIDSSTQVFTVTQNFKKLANSYDALATNYDKVGDIDKKLLSRHKAIFTSKNLDKNSPGDLMEYYNNLLTDHMIVGAIDSINYYNNLILNQAHFMEDLTAAYFYSKYAVTEYYAGNEENYLKFTLKALEYVDEDNFEFEFIYPQIYHNLSIAYTIFNNFGQVKYWAQRAIDANTKLLENNTYTGLAEQLDLIASNYSSLSQAHTQLAEYKEALKSLLVGYEYGLKSNRKHANQNLPVIEYDLAYHYLKFNHDLDSALHYIDLSIHNYEILEFVGVNDLKMLSLSLKSEILYDLQMYKESHLITSELYDFVQSRLDVNNDGARLNSHYIDICFRMCDLMIRDLHSKEDNGKIVRKVLTSLKAHVEKELNPLSHISLSEYSNWKYEILTRLNELDLSHNQDINTVISQDSEARSILLNQDQAIRFKLGFMDPQVVASYHELEMVISELETDSIKDNYSSMMLKKINERDSLLQMLNLSFPIVDRNSLMIDSLLSNQSGNHAIVLFGETSRTLFSIQLSSDSTYLEVLGEKEEIRKSISSFTKGLTCHKKFDAEASHEILQKLMPHYKRLAGFDKVSVIRCDILGNLPFELLAVGPTSGELLVDRHVINYYDNLKSVSLQPDSSDESSRVYAFAPKFNENDFNPVIFDSTLVNYTGDCQHRFSGNLVYNISGSEYLQKNYDGEYFLGTAATKQNFYELYDSRLSGERGNVLIFSTHAVSDPTDWNRSLIVLNTEGGSEDFLYSYEIQNKSISAELIVLSACETGIGFSQKGEGVMSLARSFQYAGCENVLMSLWKVEDKSTSEIINLFFNYLARGEGKSAALTLAKREYRKTNPNKSPYYWAGLVLLGDNDSIQLIKTSSIPWPWAIAIFLPVFLLIGLYIAKLKFKMF